MPDAEYRFCLGIRMSALGLSSVNAPYLRERKQSAVDNLAISRHNVVLDRK
jgi:hypothetical protein